MSFAHSWCIGWCTVLLSHHGTSQSWDSCGRIDVIWGSPRVCLVDVSWGSPLVCLVDVIWGSPRVCLVWRSQSIILGLMWSDRCHLRVAPCLSCVEVTIYFLSLMLWHAASCNKWGFLPSVGIEKLIIRGRVVGTGNVRPSASLFFLFFFFFLMKLVDSWPSFCAYKLETNPNGDSNPKR